MMLSPDSPAASAGPIHTAAAAIAARLLAAFPASRFQHEVLPAAMNLKLMSELASRRTPFVGLAYLGHRALPASGRMLSARLRFGVYLVASNPASRGRLLGDQHGPGLAQMVHAAIIGLHGWSIAAERDAGAGMIEVGDAENTDGSEWAKDNCACASLTLEVATSFTAALEPELLRIAATWVGDAPVTPTSPLGVADAAFDIVERSP